MVGVDGSGSWRGALELFFRLEVPGVELELVHCVESVVPEGPFPGAGPGATAGQLYAMLEQAGRRALAEAEEVAEARGLVCRTELAVGDPAAELVARAERSGSDLVVVHSTTKGHWGALFFGSVAKGLLIGAPCSVLVGKGEGTGATGPVDVVVATDHSDFMGRCLGHVAGWGARGFGRATVLTCGQKLPWPEGGEGMPVEGMETFYRGRTEEVARGLGFGREAEGLYLPGSLDAGIREVVGRTGAELVVMGSQGNGFFERVTVGSHALHQVLTAPHSVLVVRPGG